MMLIPAKPPSGIHPGLSATAVAAGRYEHSLAIALFALFIAVAAIIGLSIFLRQRGSAESKPVADPHRETSA